MNDIDIISCPFCGSHDIGVKDSILDEQCYAYCRRCFATGPKVHIDEESNISDEEIEELALKKWNKRNGV